MKAPIELYKLVELHADLVDLICDPKIDHTLHYISTVSNGWNRVKNSGYFDFNGDEDKISEVISDKPRYHKERSDVCMMFVMFIIQDLEDRLSEIFYIDSTIDWTARSEQ
jgi:hypothetical protein